MVSRTQKQIDEERDEALADLEAVIRVARQIGPTQLKGLTRTTMGKAQYLQLVAKLEAGLPVLLDQLNLTSFHYEKDSASKKP